MHFVDAEKTVKGSFGDYWPNYLLPLTYLIRSFASVTVHDGWCRGPIANPGEIQGSIGTKSICDEILLTFFDNSINCKKTPSKSKFYFEKKTIHRSEELMILVNIPFQVITE